MIQGYRKLALVKVGSDVDVEATAANNGLCDRSTLQRIKEHASGIGIRLQTEVFASRDSWRSYALDSLRTVERLANQLGIGDRLHVWPDKTLGSQHDIRQMPEPGLYHEWLNRWWTRISESPAWRSLHKAESRKAGGRVAKA